MYIGERRGIVMEGERTEEWRERDKEKGEREREREREI